MVRLPMIAILAAFTASGCAQLGLDDMFGGETAAQTAAACPSYATFDTDGDGLIGDGEFLEVSDSLFDEWDQTGDDMLTSDEFTACMDEGGGQLFAQLDQDGNQMLDRNEFMDEELFATWDEDQNGTLSNDEFALDEYLI
ncbi:hypothetical protein [Arenibaculum sp.]|uniref:hypothetical protein n=1 Tax=Arenibaculum sp. TaxID=2865862 RepID=UPI002E0E16AF|nr:hypothetical protein [Arenibaculum sp.]